MLKVELNHILTEDDALTHIKDVFDKVEIEKELYVVTKNGKPVFAIVDIDHLTREMPSFDLSTEEQVAAPSMQEPVATPAPATPPPPVVHPSVFSPSLPPIAPIPSMSTSIMDEVIEESVSPLLPPMPSFTPPAAPTQLTPPPAIPAAPFNPSNVPPLSGTEHLNQPTPAINPAPAEDTVPLSAAPTLDRPIVDAFGTDPRNSSPLA